MNKLMLQIGDLRVYYFNNHEEKHIKVNTVEEALDFINNEANKQLQDDTIEWNVFGLAVYDIDPNSGMLDWCEWEDLEGRDINEIRLSH